MKGAPASVVGRVVSILHTGDDANDHRFARRIENELRPFCSPSLVDVDELERMDLAGRPRSQRIQGMPVFVVSPTMLQRAHFRRKLVKATPLRNLPDGRAFYICRGISVAEIRERFPDLDVLLQDVMLGEETDLPALVKEMRTYIEHVPAQRKLGDRLLVMANFLLVCAMFCVGFVGYMAYIAAFVIAPWLAWSLLATGGDPYWEGLAACHLLFATGYGVSKMQPLNLWPLLGPAWAIGEQAFGRHPDSVLSRRSFLKAVHPWQKEAERSRIFKFSTLLWVTVPGLAVLADGGSIALGTAAFTLGMAMPGLLSVAIASFKRKAYWTLGMTKSEMQYTAKFFSDSGSGVMTTVDYKFLGRKYGRILWNRPWFARRPKIFISYAWRDEEGMATARVLERAVAELGLPCFLDTSSIPGKFASWRARVVDAILDCTHHFVVLGPNVLDAEVLHSEIKTALQRWNSELAPSVICVVEPDVAKVLRDQRVWLCLSPELTYLLEEAPKLCYAEAAQSYLVSHLIRQRRRQGLWRDWLTLLGPKRYLERFVEAESVERFRYRA